ncbi:hypothetical protein GQR58_021208 [Nymphon striatum]|nr:hypothetical protein GQR58_021208 [Nymphon striatum]
MEIAVEEGKKGILLMFEMDECPFCARMKKTVLNRGKVQDYYREALSNNHEQFRVRATPVFQFLDLKGKPIKNGRLTGASKDADEFMMLGKYIIEGANEKMPFIRYKRKQKKDSSLIGINEDMAGTFISWDRAKIRQELKQYSEIIVAKLEAEYQEVRQQYFSGQATQRLTHLYAEALKNNKWLKTLRETYNKDQVVLYEMDLRQQILELILRIGVLKAAADRAEAELYSRDLDLEMSRTLYEMEVRARIGKSMTLQSKARMEEERVKYCTTIAWAQLNALTGKPILTQPEEAKEEAQ